MNKFKQRQAMRYLSDLNEVEQQTLREDIASVIEQAKGAECMTRIAKGLRHNAWDGNPPASGRKWSLPPMGWFEGIVEQLGFVPHKTPHGRMWSKP